MSEHNFSIENFNKYREESEKAVNEALLDVRRYPRSRPNPRKRKQEPAISWPQKIKVEIPDVDPDLEPEDEEMCCLAQLDGTRCPLEHCNIPLGELLLTCAEQNDCPLVMHPMSNHFNICVFHWKQIKYSRRGRLYEELTPMSKIEELELMADLDAILEEKQFRRREEEESDSSDSEESSSSSEDEGKDEEEDGMISSVEEYSSESEFDDDEETESEIESEADDHIWKNLEIDVRDRTLMNGLKALSMVEEGRQRADPDSDDESLNGWEVEEDGPLNAESDEVSTDSDASEDEDTSISSSSDESTGDEEQKLVNGINSPEEQISTGRLEDDETSNVDDSQEPKVASLSMITRHRIRLQLLNGDRYHEEAEEELTYQQNGLSDDDTDEDEEKENHDPLEEEDEEDEDMDESTDSQEDESSDESSEDSDSSDDESSESSDDDLDTDEEKSVKDEEANDPEAFGPSPIHEQLNHIEVDLDSKTDDEDLELFKDDNPKYEMWQDEKDTSSESEDSDESEKEEVGHVDVNEPVDNPEEIALILQGMSTLPLTTLRRYRKYHGIPTRATATKVSMLPMIARHYSAFKVDPDPIQASFLNKRKKRHPVHRHLFRR